MPVWRGSRHDRHDQKWWKCRWIFRKRKALVAHRTAAKATARRHCSSCWPTVFSVPCEQQTFKDKQKNYSMRCVLFYSIKKFLWELEIVCKYKANKGLFNSNCIVTFPLHWSWSWRWILFGVWHLQTAHCLRLVFTAVCLRLAFTAVCLRLAVLWLFGASLFGPANG